MEIKVYTVKLDTPRWVKRAIVYGVLPVGALLGAALAARAGVTLTTFTPNTKISAQEVNANFKALNDAIGGLAATGAIPKISAWQSYPVQMTGSDGAKVTGQTTTGVYRRVGDSIEVDIVTSFTAAPSASTSYFRWSLPANVTIDPARLAATPTTGGGVSALLGEGAAAEGFVFSALAVFTVGEAKPSGVVAVSHGGFWVNEKSPFTFNGGAISLRFTAPVSGWTVTTP